MKNRTRNKSKTQKKYIIKAYLYCIKLNYRIQLNINKQNFSTHFSF